MKITSLPLLVLPTAASVGVGFVSAQESDSARQITSDPAQEDFPSWSPGGKTLVYSYTILGDSLGARGLWKIDADGGNPRRFTDFIGEHPDGSPDDRRIAFREGTNL